MKMTIDKKVSLIISLIIFVFGTLIGIYTIQDEAEHMNQVLDDKATVLLDNLAYNLEYLVLVRDAEAVSRLVKGVLAQKEIFSCRVDDKNGMAIYEERKEGNGEVREFSSTVIARRAGEEEELIFGAQQEVTEEVGKVTLAVSLSELNSKISNLRYAITAFILAVISLISLAMYLLLKRLIGRPVGRLVAATERLAAGDLGYRIPHITRDEFEKLAVSFNQMAGALLEAQEELVRKEKLSTLGQLAGSVGHEIRNPLGVMNNAVYYLKTIMSGADETVKEYLGIMESEIKNSQRIITDLLDFARTKPPQTRMVSVPELVKQSLMKCSVPNTVAVSLELSEKLPRVKTDLLQMEQVLVNFITNAVQAMPGGGSVRISARRVQSERSKYPELKTMNSALDADFVEISVADTGEGIPPENMKKLFQPLFTTKARGIGLGLVVCKNLVEANGGTISVESELGKGTTFTLALPAEENDRTRLCENPACVAAFA